LIKKWFFPEERESISSSRRGPVSVLKMEGPEKKDPKLSPEA